MVCMYNTKSFTELNNEQSLINHVSKIDYDITQENYWDITKLVTIYSNQ